MALVLLGTQACHLCEQAQALIISFQSLLKVDVYVEDIAESAEQVERYGLRIPVLLDDKSNDELDWPFNPEQLQKWLLERDCLHSALA